MLITVSDTSVRKGAADITASVMVDFPYKILPLGLYPVNTDPADAFFGLVVEHSDDFFDLSFSCHEKYLPYDFPSLR